MPSGAGASTKRSRWDQTPALGGGATPALAPGVTPSFFSAATPAVGAPGATPLLGMETPSLSALGAAGAGGPGVPMTPEAYQEMRLQREMWERNRPLSDEELDAMLPGEKDGYKVGAQGGQKRRHAVLQCGRSAGDAMCWQGVRIHLSHLVYQKASLRRLT